VRCVSCVFVYSISDPSKHDGWMEMEAKQSLCNTS
jgi:hypothetical protein